MTNSQGLFIEITCSFDHMSDCALISDEFASDFPKDTFPMEAKDLFCVFRDLKFNLCACFET